MSLWERQIEFPDHALTLVEILDILLTCLTRKETEEFAEGLLCNLQEDGRDADPFECEVVA